MSVANLMRRLDALEGGSSPVKEPIRAIFITGLESSGPEPFKDRIYGDGLDLRRDPGESESDFRKRAVALLPEGGATGLVPLLCLVSTSEAA